MLETHILKINKNIERYDFDRLLGYVSEKKKERIRRFHRFEDAQRTLLGDILTRYAICNKLGIKNKDLVFGTNDYGKPVLSTPHGIHFNMSHSGNWVVCAINDGGPVGVDVEVIKPVDLAVAKNFFSSDEYISIINQPKELQQKYFFIIWTLKESYIKAEGKGLSIPLNSFSIKIVDHNIYVSTTSDFRKYYFHQSFLDYNATYALCTLTGNSNKVIDCNIEQFLKDCINDYFV